MEVSDISHRIIADLLRERTGQQITEGRRWRIGTALGSLFREYGISNVDQLVCLLANPDMDDLADKVVEALLNNETYFFRDRQLFERISTTVLPDLALRRASGKRLSIWSAGCSTGQETLSLAMLFASAPESWHDWTIDILGTDVSGQAIDTARRGVYSQFEVQRGLGVDQMLSYFSETEAGWKPKPGLLRPLRFRQHNVLDPLDHEEQFDLVLCRNVMLYFDQANKQQAFARLSDVLAEDGWLMLGAGETAVGRTREFAPASQVSGGLYRRKQRNDGANRNSCRSSTVASAQ